MLVLAVLFLSLLGLAEDESVVANHDPAADLYLKVQLPRAVKISKLKAGDLVHGTLSRDV